MSWSTSASTSLPPTDTFTDMIEHLPYRVRVVDSKDIGQLVELEALLFPDNNMNERTLEIEIQHGVCLVVERDDRVVGYVLVRRDRDITDVLRLGVQPEHQGRGVGARLLVAAIGRSCSAMLTVAKINEPALQPYEKMGFKISGELGTSWVMRRYMAAAENTNRHAAFEH